MKILAIDPSVNNVGIAFWDSTKEKVIQTRLFHPTKKKDEVGWQRMIRITKEIHWFLAYRVTRNLEIDFLVLEYPQWEGSERGSIASQKGYTLDLAYISGYLSAIYSLPICCIFLPTPRDWKGNMPKSATAHRVQKYFGTLQISEHEMDAIGMILWAKELPGIKG